MTYAFVFLDNLVIISNLLGVFGISPALAESFIYRSAANGDRLLNIKTKMPEGMTIVDFMDAVRETVNNMEL